MSGERRDPEAITIEVRPEWGGDRLDRVLARLPAIASRARAQALIASGSVAVDGRVVRDKSYRVAPGTVITAELAAAPAEADEQPAPAPRLAYEDEHLLVIDKPPGVAVHGGAGVRVPTLDAWLRAHGAAGGDPSRPGVVHRLDRDTSGLLVVVRSESAYRELARLIRERAVARHYLALVAGVPAATRAVIEAPIGRDRRRRVRMTIGGAGARAAVTRFEVRERHARSALLELALVTGRTHQIRAHLQAIGHPVAGDPTYGGQRLGAQLGLRRQFLHAARLAFPHPVSRQRIELASPLPPDLAQALERARTLD